MEIKEYKPFKQENVNPRNLKTNDCVIRAIAKATGKSWHLVFASLCDIAGQRCEMPNSKRVYEKYLELNGWEKQKMPKHLDNTRYTVREFLVKNNKGTFIISIANHITVGIDGVLIDTWNCERKSVGNYWVKK